MLQKTNKSLLQITKSNLLNWFIADGLIGVLAEKTNKALLRQEKRLTGNELKNASNQHRL